MSARQDYVDALNQCVELNAEYNAILDEMKMPGGLELTVERIGEIDALHKRLEAANLDLVTKMQSWLESGEG